ncbi:MAG TPA: porin family protein [Candidatus Krumholzibacteria bacterium]|nr:porin family protein [Candidatus Krumholzibacteria bacterium]
MQRLATCSTALVVAALVVAGLASPVRAGNNVYGFRGGVNISTLKGEDPVDLDSVNRPVAGVVGVFGLTPWLGFQIEALWSGKGAEGTLPFSYFGGTLATGSMTLDYLEIPLLLRFTPAANGRWRPFLYGGPGFAANLSADAEASVDGTPISPKILAGLEQIIADGDLLLMGGAGIGAVVSGRLFELDVRYSAGLVNIDESRRSFSPHNRTVSVSLALLLGHSLKSIAE